MTFQPGLSESGLEKSSCGVGLLVNARKPASHWIVRQGLKMLSRLSHRSAVGADGRTSDGAGILVQIPDAFFRKELRRTIGRDPLPRAGNYAVAQIFSDPRTVTGWREALEEKTHSLGFQVLAWRDVPVDSSQLGVLAKDSEPLIHQFFLTAQVGLTQPWDLNLSHLRRWAEASFPEIFICSLSRTTIVYKGLMQPGDLAAYFPDLQDEEFQSQMAMTHARFSTNTLPAWKLAQPFRYACHNGEINTIQGNRNWMKSREKDIREALTLPPGTPLLSEGRSDSANFDEALELLLLLGYSPTQALSSLIPQAWEHNPELPKALQDYYQFQSSRLEPWDGPAAICFTNGTICGASLDRNGLRPFRYHILEDGTLIAGSEAGVLDMSPAQIVRKGRLQPGQMLTVDLRNGEIDLDGRTLLEEAGLKPYVMWNSQELISPKTKLNSSVILPADVRTLSRYGYQYDEIHQVLMPMFVHHEEATSSMGADTPLALLSDHPQLLFNYFRQGFAQVTNPPIDPIRERSVMSLRTYLGSRASLVFRETDGRKRWALESPVLSQDQILLLHSWSVQEEAPLKTAVLGTRFPVAASPEDLAAKVESICQQAEDLVRHGHEVLILSDRWADEAHSAIPSLLVVSAVHHHLTRQQLRTQTSLVVESGEVRDVHQTACLVSFGADAVHPLMIQSLIRSLIENQDLPASLSNFQAWENYFDATNKGLLKILSKLGISTLQSYCGAQTFEILGISKSLVDKYWTGAVSRIGGLTLESLTEEVRKRWTATSTLPSLSTDISHLPSRGDVHYRVDGELHQWSPQSIAKLQMATRQKDAATYKEFSEAIRETEKATLRGHLDFRWASKSVPLSEVEPAAEIVKRFTTGAMSLGALGREAHETLALAMNAIGAQSNSGEGGEDPERFQTLRNSSIKQIASARFGVTTSYLVHAKELQIKMAQGAKPGEGGQLPGHKVNEEIAKLRHSNPGVTLISPPPHHDIYSIEDLAQLIFDLKNVNPQARVSVKLVAKAGVGTIAAGVVKAGAHKILISGDGGGTGASPLSSIRSAGVPWELGLSETHQTLVMNGLRSQIRLETDGQLRTGRDVAIAAILGADEFGFSTAPLVVEGCVMMRKCHLNTCPVGVATQDPVLRAKFTGQPEHVINYFFFVAEELRELMASLGVRKVDELIGRTDFLKPVETSHWKAKNLDLKALLHSPKPLHSKSLRPPAPHYFDEDLLKNQLGLLANQRHSPLIPIENTNRSAGTWLSGTWVRSGEKLKSDLILNFHGSAGQSFGAFLTQGLTLKLTGEANDYVGKGLSGGELVIAHDPRFQTKDANPILVGNTCLYGATSGQAFIAGAAGERFAVRNSGALAVVESVGDHGCEYMTGGRVVVLGPTGKNFAAGMSGGLAYVWDAGQQFASRCNPAMVDLESLTAKDEEWLWMVIQTHHAKTNSQRAGQILTDWPQAKKLFRKVFPKDERRLMESEISKQKPTLQPASLAL